MAYLRTYYLYSDLVCAELKRFANSLEGNFKEAKDHAVNIKDKDHELFGYFVEYIYVAVQVSPTSLNRYFCDYSGLARLRACIC